MWLNHWVIKVTLCVFDEDLDAEFGEAIREEKRSERGKEVVMLHPCKLGDREEARVCAEKGEE